MSPSFTITLAFELAKLIAKHSGISNTHREIVEEVSNLGGEELKAKLESLRAHQRLAAEILRACEEAERCFLEKIGHKAFYATPGTITLSATQSIYSAISRLRDDIDGSVVLPSKLDSQGLRI
jgi:hypothetical protein